MKLLALTFKGIVYLVLLLGLSSCMETSYRSTGSMWTGFSDVQLAPNKFRINFNGNITDEKSKIRDFTLLRSAEVTIENGFKYFVVLDEKNLTEEISSSMPMTSYSSGSLSGGSFSANTQYYGGGTAVFRAPIFNNTIICYTKKPQGLDSYDATFLVNSLKKAYDITPENTNSFF
jgi:hypothetical protein